jgi:hypothetical protein
MIVSSNIAATVCLGADHGAILRFFSIKYQCDVGEPAAERASLRISATPPAPPDLEKLTCSTDVFTTLR